MPLAARDTLHGAVRGRARASASCTRLFRRRRPAIVHTHNPKPGVYGRIAARMAGTPAIVNTVHGLYALPEDSLARRTAVYGLERTAAAFSHAELVQNEEDLAVLRRLRVPDDRLELLGNGIDLERFDPEPIHRGGCRVGVPRARHGRGERGGRRRRRPARGREGVSRALRGGRARLPDSVRVAVIGFDEPDKSDALSADGDRRSEVGRCSVPRRS